MRERHRSQVVLSRDFVLDTSICALDPKAFVAFLHLANWSSLWNLAGRIPKDLVLSLLGRHASTKTARLRILEQLTRQFAERWPACLLDAGDEYLVSPALVTYIRQGSDWDRSDVQKVVERDRSTCRYCGCECIGDLSIDHVFPRSRGGSDKPANLVVACLGCNSRKGDRTPEEAKMPLLPATKEPA